MDGDVENDEDLENDEVVESDEDAENDEVVEPIDEDFKNELAAAYLEHGSMLQGFAMRLCRDEEMAEELVRNAFGLFVTKRRTRRKDVPLGAQLVQTVRTLFSNERAAARNKTRDTKAQYDAQPSSKPNPENALDEAEGDREFAKRVRRIHAQLGEDPLAIEALAWFLRDDGESLVAYAARVGHDKKKFEAAYKRALYAAQKVGKREKWR